MVKPESCLYFQDILSLTCRIPLVKNQNSLYETCSLAICINIQAFGRVNKKQGSIRKTFLEYLEFYIVGC